LERYLKCKVIRYHKCYINHAGRSTKYWASKYIEFKKDQEFLYKIEDSKYFLKGKGHLFTLDGFEINKSDFENFFISKREENLNSILNS
jgi:hypothetical protein